MAGHGQESKSDFICSHVKRQSLLQVPTWVIRESLFEGKCWNNGKGKINKMRNLEIEKKKKTVIKKVNNVKE